MKVSKHLWWPYERESKTVLDSGFCACDSGLKVLDSGFFVSGTWNSDSLSCIPGSKAQEPDVGFPHKQNVPGFWNPHSLTWGYKDVSKLVNNCICCSLCFELPNDKCKIFCFCLTNCYYKRFSFNIAVVTCPNEFSCVILLLSSTAHFQAVILIFQLIPILTYPSPKPTFALSEN